MPVMGGCEATYRIRSNPATRRIPIIILSSDCEGELGNKARAAGCNECLQKPADLATIREVVRRYIS